MFADLLTISEAQIAEEQYQEIENVKEKLNEVYWDIQYALNKYEEAIAKKEKPINDLFDKLSDLRKELDALRVIFPPLKQTIEELQEREKTENE